MEKLQKKPFNLLPNISNFHDFYNKWASRTFRKSFCHEKMHNEELNQT